MATEHHISAEHLELVLVTRRMRRTKPGIARFAAMSEGAETRDCNPARGATAWRITNGPMFSPMRRGRIVSVVTRTRRQHGLAEVRRTWGIGVRAMLAECQGSLR